MVKTIIQSIDSISAKGYLKFFRERNSLIILLFHGIFENENDIRSGMLDPEPHKGITIQKFRQIIEHFLANNYLFVSPDDILNGLRKGGRYILITFDDGYFNNYNALTSLREYGVPALFFISADNVTRSKSFWWDVIYRERMKSGMPVKKIALEQKDFKQKTAEEIEIYIIKNFGEKALRPKSDIDRPFTPLELKKISQEKYVHIGNHTAGHAILSNYTSDGIKRQIISCQQAIREITGISPIAISYPNGSYSKETIRIAREAGMAIGITTLPRKNYLPMETGSESMLSLGRFLLEEGKDLSSQCDVIRSDISLYNQLKGRFRDVDYSTLSGF